MASQSSTLAELMVAACSPARPAASIWSRISASSGEITNVGPDAVGPQRRGGGPVDGRLAPPGGLPSRRALSPRPGRCRPIARTRPAFRAESPVFGSLVGLREDRIRLRVRVVAPGLQLVRGERVGPALHASFVSLLGRHGTDLRPVEPGVLPAPRRRPPGPLGTSPAATKRRRCRVADRCPRAGFVPLHAQTIAVAAVHHQEWSCCMPVAHCHVLPSQRWTCPPSGPERLQYLVSSARAAFVEGREQPLL